MTNNVIGLVPKTPEAPEHMGEHLRAGLEKMGTLDKADGSYVLIQYDAEGNLAMFTNVEAAGNVLFLMEMIKLSLITGEFHEAE